MADGLTMDAGDALNRVVAAALGWSYFETESDWSDDAIVGYIEFQVTTGLAPDGERRRVPDYSRDLNAAITLIPRGQHVRFVLSSIPAEYRALNAGDWEADINVGTFDSHRHYVGQADTPALAIVRAWLAWHAAGMDGEGVSE
jgi:hypothetical protein